MANMALISCALSLLVCFGPTDASSHLTEEHKGSQAFLSSKAFQEEITNAMAAVLGCGGPAGEAKIASTQAALRPMWETLPKTSSSSDRVDRRSMRYLVHRYFMQTSSLMIRGFEPSRPVNESHWGVADILSQIVPAYVEAAFESSHAKANGFSIKDATSMVIMLEQLILDSESNLLTKAYTEQGKTIQKSLSHKGLMQVLEHYLVHWMVDADAEDMEILLSNRSLLSEVVPLYDELVSFAEGRAKMLKYEQKSQVPKGHGVDIWTGKYSFEDAHSIIGGMTKSFQSFWQSECETMNDALKAMDTHHTGRVPLAKFYNTAINDDWRFGESESYLRELGALDETSTLAGAQVIIPNYIQATSNCIISTSHYLVCCRNACEDIMGEIELSVAAPSATVEELLPFVSNMTIGEEDEQPTITSALKDQLESIAKSQGGMVPLHGRLFAQWLHYVFPRECPFPHMMGAVSSVTPQDFGDDYVATIEDMKKHATNANISGLPDNLGKEELQWMSQFSPEEELMVDYSSEMGMSWPQKLFIVIGGLVFLFFGLSGGVVSVGTTKKAASPQFNQKCYV